MACSIPRKKCLLMFSYAGSWREEADLWDNSSDRWGRSRHATGESFSKLECFRLNQNPCLRIYLPTFPFSWEGVVGGAESQPPREIHSRFIKCLCDLYRSLHPGPRPTQWNITDVMSCQQMFVPAPRALEYVSHCMRMFKHVSYKAVEGF